MNRKSRMHYSKWLILVHRWRMIRILKWIRNLVHLIILHQKFCPRNMMRNVISGVAELFCLFFSVDHHLSMEKMMNKSCKRSKLESNQIRERERWTRYFGIIWRKQGGLLMISHILILICIGFHLTVKIGLGYQMELDLLSPRCSR